MPAHVSSEEERASPSTPPRLTAASTGHDDPHKTPTRRVPGISARSPSSPTTRLDVDTTPKAAGKAVPRMHPYEAELTAMDPIGLPVTHAPLPTTDYTLRDDLSLLTRYGGAIQPPPSATKKRADSANLARLKSTYKTVMDLFRAGTIPRLPAPYSKTKLRSTKKVTKHEIDLKAEDQLDRIVYLPDLLKEAEKIGEKVLSHEVLDWKKEEHVLLAAFCLADVIAALLPEIINSEDDVVAWGDCTILRPALTALRLIAPSRSPDVTDPPLDFSLSSAPSKGIIPDRIFFKGIRYEESLVREPRAVRGKGEGKAKAKEVLPRAHGLPIATVELKTQNVWVDDKFKAIFQMKEGASHTMHFVWPTDQKTQQGPSEHRIIMQVWCQMADAGVNYAILTCHDRTVYLMRRGKTMYVSKQYESSEAPHFRAFCLLLVARGDVDYESVLPEPKFHPGYQNWLDKRRKNFENRAAGKRVDPSYVEKQQLQEEGKFGLIEESLYNSIPAVGPQAEGSQGKKLRSGMQTQ